MMNREFWDSELGFGTVLGQFRQESEHANRRTAGNRSKIENL